MKGPSLFSVSARNIMVVGIVLMLLTLAVPNVTDGRTLVVNQQHSSANDENAGTEDNPLATISRAAELALPGDTVLVHAGVYRERVSPARGGEEGKPIVYMAAPGEEVHIKGSDIWRPTWQPVAGQRNVYLAKLDSTMFGKYNPCRTELSVMKNRTCGQIFVDGKHFKEMESLEEVYATPGSWIATAERDGIYVRFYGSVRPPENRMVELTTRGRIFAPYKRSLGYIQVKGFTMEHCGNNYPYYFYWTRSGSLPQAGALGCRGGHHWVIENNTIRWAKTVGLDCGTEGPLDAEGLNQPKSTKAGHHLIRNNVISDNGSAGILGYQSLRTKIIGNVFERNNNLGFNAAENGGVKTHFFVGGLIEGNLFRDNECIGLWLDNVYAQTRITRNVLVNNRNANIFIEMGGGPLLIDNNIIALSRRGWHNASGLYTLDAGGVTIAHNLFVYNASFAVTSYLVGTRGYRVYPEDIQSWNKGWDGDDPIGIGEKKRCLPENIKIFNNIMMGGSINLPLPSPLSKGNRSDYNLFNPPWTLTNLPFVANNKGPGGKPGAGLQYHEVVKQLEIAYKRGNVSPDEGNQPRYFHKAGVGDSYYEGTMLSLRQWRLMGMDKHSLMTSVPGNNIRALDLDVSLKVDESPWKLGCKPIRGVDKDFFGNPMPGNPLPGPFQNLKEGDNRLIIWPVKGTRLE